MLTMQSLRLIPPSHLTSQFHQVISPAHSTMSSHRLIPPCHLSGSFHHVISLAHSTMPSLRFIPPFHLTPILYLPTALGGWELFTSLEGTLSSVRLFLALKPSQCYYYRSLLVLETELSVSTCIQNSRERIHLFSSTQCCCI